MDQDYTEPANEVEAGETEQADQDVTPNFGDDSAVDDGAPAPDEGWGADEASGAGE